MSLEQIENVGKITLDGVYFIEKYESVTKCKGIKFYFILSLPSTTHKVIVLEELFISEIIGILGSEDQLVIDEILLPL